MKQLRINDHIKGKAFKYMGRYTWEIGRDFKVVNNETLFYINEREIIEYGY